MGWTSIVFTGVSGAGKTTLSVELCRRDPSFERVVAVTTRAARADDGPGLYEYLSDEQFDAVERESGLFVRAEYRGKRYGITHAHLAEVAGRGKAPVALLTPRSLHELLSFVSPPVPFLTVFVDAPDELLDARLRSRQDADRPAIARQRAEDRRYRDSCHRVLVNLDVERSLEQLAAWWQAGPE